MVRQPLADLHLHDSQCPRSHPSPILSLNFHNTCPCAAFNIDAYGDDVHTCNKITGIATAHNEAVHDSAPLFSSLGNSVGSQVKVMVVASQGHAGQRWGDIEMVNYHNRCLASKTNLVLICLSSTIVMEPTTPTPKTMASSASLISNGWIGL